MTTPPVSVVSTPRDVFASANHDVASEGHLRHDSRRASHQASVDSVTTAQDGGTPGTSSLTVSDHGLAERMVNLPYPRAYLERSLANQYLSPANLARATPGSLFCIGYQLAQQHSRSTQTLTGLWVRGTHRLQRFAQKRLLPRGQHDQQPRLDSLKQAVRHLADVSDDPERARQARLPIVQMVEMLKYLVRQQQAAAPKMLVLGRRDPTAPLCRLRANGSLIIPEDHADLKDAKAPMVLHPFFESLGYFAHSGKVTGLNLQALLAGYVVRRSSRKPSVDESLALARQKVLLFMDQHNTRSQIESMSQVTFSEEMREATHWLARLEDRFDVPDEDCAPPLAAPDLSILRGTDAA
jgi:hypothetical protein